VVADVSPDLRRQGYLRREKNANFGNGWATTVGKTKTVRSSEYGSLHVGQSAPKTSSAATLVAVVQLADLRNRENLARRGRSHSAWPGTILVKGKMCSASWCN
jgi:hypothetical protein